MKQTITGILFYLIFSTHVQAQQSMLQEISAPYLERLIKTAKENYPRQKIFTQQIGIAQNNLNKVKLSWFDGLGIYYLFNPPTSPSGSINPTSSSGGFQFGFSFNVGSLTQKPAQINAAKGDQEIARLQKAEYELTIEATVKERYYKYIQQVTLLKQRTQLALDAQSMLTSVRSKFERGQETFDNYSQALVFLNLQNQERVNTESELLTAKAHLEEIINKKLEDLDDITIKGN